MFGQQLFSEAHQGIPNELLVMILRNVPDIKTLFNLILAYPQARLLFETLYRKIFPCVVRNSGIPLQIQKLVCAVFCVGSWSCSPSDQELEEYFKLRLENENTALVIDSLPDPVAALQSIAEISQDLDYFEKSFIKCRLHEPDRELSTEHGEALLSTTEVHRIRRAFWRLQLYSDVYHPFRPMSAVDCSDDEDGWRDPGAFWNLLAYWEVDELECTYHHLVRQLQILQSGHREGDELEMARITRLLNTSICSSSNSGLNSDKHNDQGTEMENYFSFTIPFHRDLICGTTTTTLWSDSAAANYSNAGCRCFFRYDVDLGVPMAVNGGEPIACSLAWGYCIWDEAQLQRWDLLHHSRTNGDVWKWNEGERLGWLCERHRD